MTARHDGRWTRRPLAGLLAVLLVGMALTLAASAQGDATPLVEARPDAATATPPDAAEASGGVVRGPATGLPMPRFVSLRASEARVRRGPSLQHRVDWLYTRRGLPLRVTAEHGNWRRVEDIEGFGGWVHHSLITGRRSVIVTEHLAPLLRRPAEGSPMVAKLERGVIAELEGCEAGWCHLSADGRGGWARAEALWGVEDR